MIVKRDQGNETDWKGLVEGSDGQVAWREKEAHRRCVVERRGEGEKREKEREGETQRRQGVKAAGEKKKSLSVKIFKHPQKKY